MVHTIRSILLLTVVALFFGGAGSSAPDAKWLEKLPASDRAYLQNHVGYAPPAFSSDILWAGSEPVDWESLRGKVVILQSWTTRSRSGRKVVERLNTALDGYDPAQVAVILLHTPDGRDNVERFLEKKPIGHPVAIDRTGLYCDTIGFYKKPTNIVVDRQGNVRLVGVRTGALDDAIRPLVDAAFDAQVAANVRAVATTPEAYPPFVGEIRSATDIRGQQAPALHVEQWLNGEPSVEGQILIVDFWATWCPPCVASIPHMNKIATTTGANVTVIGISGETLDRFENGMRGLERSRKITMDTFKYTIALDPSGRMTRAINNRGIPHALVISPDGIVRWQGHPAGLSVETVKQIARAAQSNVTGGVTAPAVRRRWTR